MDTFHIQTLYLQHFYQNVFHIIQRRKDINWPLLQKLTQCFEQLFLNDWVTILRDYKSIFQVRADKLWTYFFNLKFSRSLILVSPFSSSLMQ